MPVVDELRGPADAPGAVICRMHAGRTRRHREYYPEVAKNAEGSRPVAGSLHAARAKARTTDPALTGVPPDASLSQATDDPGRSAGREIPGAARNEAHCEPDPRSGERPLGSDEPSAPDDVPPGSDRPGIGPDVTPGDPSGPDLPA